MGQIVLPATGLVYVDTSAVIYYVEQIEPYLSASMPLWDALHQGQQPIVTSELTLTEALVKPLRDGNQALCAFYRTFLFSSAGLTCIPVNRAILESAALVRALHGPRTPDAIHAATALGAGCTLFVTNDAGFRRVPGLNVAILSVIAAS